jgi:hypothetical protein
MRDREPLFSRNDMHATMESHKKHARAKVDAINSAQFLSSTDEQLVEHVCAEMHVETLQIYEDRAQMHEEECKVDVSGDFRYGGWPGERTLVPGLMVKITIPYTGDEGLWQIRPTSSWSNSPYADVNPVDHQGVGSIAISMTRPAGADPKEFKRYYDEQLKLIKDYITNQTRDLQNHLQQLPGHARQLVEARRDRLGKQASVRQVLNIPLATRPGAPSVAPISAPRKLVRPLPPAPSAKPEPTIRDEDYEHILSVIRHEGRSFETTPETFAKHGEEELRDIVMAHLNGHYQGGATGERFRKKGKTDICIEDQNRAAFVAECKVWRGAKEAGEAADQLLSYLTWRDCKCCLVFFNSKVAGFSGVQMALADALRCHPSVGSDSGTKEPGEWRFRFRQPGDEQRIVAVHVFCFDLYVKPVEKKGKAKS